MRYLTMFTLGLLLLAGVSVLGQKSGDSTGNGDHPSFQYVIVGHFTKLQKDVNQHADYWVLEVLLEEEAFSEGNLTELFRLLGKRFADRPGLVVNVFTSLKALRTPEEYDRTDRCCLRKDYRKYKYAIYNRDDNGERFVYEIPGRQPRKEVFVSRPDK